MSQKKRILVVDDEPQIQRFLNLGLQAAGYDLLLAANGAEALRLAATMVPDLMVLDLGLPDMDGKEVLQRLRKWSGMPVIVLSARDDEREKIGALDLGANDYVAKPFGIGELLARIRVSLRTAPQDEAEPAVFRVCDISIDVGSHRVDRAGAAIRLTPKEFELLLQLVQHQGKLMTHRQLLTKV